MKNNKEIGGFFELELNNCKEYHNNAIRLNSGRNCLHYILKVKKYKKIYIPYYICNSVIETFDKLNVKYEFYSINESFKPNFSKKLMYNEALLYVNYFGVNKRNVVNLLQVYSNIIVDNTQAFFQRQINNEDTFYSPRKFFGVSDGGYLYVNRKLEEHIKRDKSFSRFEHLLKRIDNNTAKNSYVLFKENEKFIKNQSVKEMSQLTKKILASVDYENVKKIRNENFIFLHKNLAEYNELKLDVENLNSPMVYPFLTNINGLREFLIDKNIYVATYWKEVLDKIIGECFEYKLVKNLIPIPIDQRYGICEMEIIIKNINSYILSGMKRIK